MEAQSQQENLGSMPFLFLYNSSILHQVDSNSTLVVLEPAYIRMWIARYITMLCTPTPVTYALICIIVAMPFYFFACFVWRWFPCNFFTVSIIDTNHISEVIIIHISHISVHYLYENPLMIQNWLKTKQNHVWNICTLYILLTLSITLRLNAFPHCFG